MKFTTKKRQLWIIILIVHAGMVEEEWEEQMHPRCTRHFGMCASSFQRLLSSKLLRSSVNRGGLKVAQLMCMRVYLQQPKGI